MTLAKLPPTPSHQTCQYWSDEEVLSGKLIMLPTMRLAKLHRIERDGKRVFITPQSKLLCEHGECPSTIFSWIHRETKALAAGAMVPKRSSCCDCLNTDGLYHTHAKPPPAEPPASPPSLYDYLELLDTCKSIVNGRVARHVPYTHGSKAMYLTQKGGHFVCMHHHTLATIRKMRKVRAGTAPAAKIRGGPCNCDLDNLPHRNGLKRLPRITGRTCSNMSGNGEVARYRKPDACPLDSSAVSVCTGRSVPCGLVQGCKDKFVDM